MGTRILHRLLAPAAPLVQSIILKSSFQRQPVSSASCSLILSRNYAKSKDRGKEKSKNPHKVEINPLMMSELISVDKLKTRCQGAIEKMKDEFVKNLSIRSTTGTVESLKVKFDGKEYELQELAQIIRKNPKTMVMNFASFPQAIPDALKAIQASGLNINPQQDGTTLFVPVPKVTKEHREALAKNAKIIYIKYRDAISDIQNENLKIARKAKSEDLSRSVQIQINAMCDKYKEECKQLFHAKHVELVGK